MTTLAHRQPIPLIRPIPALSRVLDALLATPVAGCWLAVYEWSLPGAEMEIVAWAQANGLVVESDDKNPDVPSMRVLRDGRVLVSWHGNARAA